MSTNNNPVRQPGAYAFAHYDTNRVATQHQLERISVATHPPSCSNSPVSLVYQPELKRSFLFQSNLSNPQRYSQLSKTGESTTGHEQLYYPQPNVQYCMIEKQKNSTPTHSTYTVGRLRSFTDNGKAQLQSTAFNQRSRKGSEECPIKPPMESPTMYQQERRVNIQQPHSFVIRTTIGSPQFTHPDSMRNSAMVHSAPIVPIQAQSTAPHNDPGLHSEQGSMQYRAPIDQHVVIKGSPSSNYSENKLTVKFEYQQPRQEVRQDRLDHIKNKTYAELVNRPNNYAESSTERVMVSRHSTGPNEEGRSLSVAYSMKELNPKLTQSMHARTGCQEHYVLQANSTQCQTDKLLERVGMERRPELLMETRSQTDSADCQTVICEPDNAFKKDKRFSLEPSKSIYDPAKLSPQNAPPRKQSDSKKIAKLSQTPELPKSTAADCLKQTKYTPTHEFGHSNKYSPTSFTKVKTEGPSNLTASNKNFVECSTASPLSSASGSPRKVPIRRRPCLDDFKIGRKLGKGKYGDVFLVEHKFTGFLCAMKIVEKRLIREEGVQHQLIREIKLQSYLRHENIVQLYGYFDDSDNFYLLLEFCADGELSELIRQHKRLSESEASNIIEQLCRGVDFMHRHRVIHRDIKPQNIIMQDGIVKVCDFGWAVHVANGLRQTFCGTPLYVSPEVLKGQFYDFKIDIWAIGVLTYELLIGKVPFRINCETDLSKIINDEICFPDYVEISSHAKDFIHRTLQKDPNVRIEMDELLNHPFLAGSKRKEYMRHLNE